MVNVAVADGVVTVCSVNGDDVSAAEIPTGADLVSDTVPLNLFWEVNFTVVLSVVPTGIVREDGSAPMEKSGLSALTVMFTL